MGWPPSPVHMLNQKFRFVGIHFDSVRPEIALGREVGILLGKAFGVGLQQNIEDCYLYLMDRYEEGDKVFLFGFSRGAFTARALAGMLKKCGLLQKGSRNLISYASKIYNTKNNKACLSG